MNNAELKQCLEQGLGAYLSAFCASPAQAAFVATVTDDTTEGALTVTPQDLKTFNADPALKAELSRTFNNLSRFLDDARTAGGVRFFKR